MKGLLYKEAVLSKPWLIFLAFIEAVCIVAICINESGIELSMVFNICCALIMYLLTGIVDNNSHFAPDEKNNWRIFVSATPGTMREQILCKYLFILFENMAILVVGIFLDFVVMFMTLSFSLAASAVIFVAFCAVLFAKALVLPFLVRFGAVIGEKIFLIVFTLLLVAAGGYFLFGDVSFLNGDNRKSIYEFIFGIVCSNAFKWISILLPLVAGGAYWLSYRISLKLYRKSMDCFGE